MLKKLLLAALVLAAPWASAHEMTMAEMELRETAPGEFNWQWSASSDKRPVSEDLAPRWPPGCSPMTPGFIAGKTDSPARSASTASAAAIPPR